MKIINGTNPPANAHLIGSLTVKRRVEQELLVGDNKNDLHPLIKDALHSKFRNCLGEIDMVMFSVSRNEDCGIQGLRVVSIDVQAFLDCSR